MPLLYFPSFNALNMLFVDDILLALSAWYFFFLKSTFGICLGCKFYPLFFKEKSTLCAGEVCSIKPKQDIQKISASQLLIVFAFVAFISYVLVI